MAGESKEILELSKHLIPVFGEIRNAARMMADASEKLSNTGLDKFADQLKKTLKEQNLISEADLQQISDAKSLQKVLSKLEDQYEALHKLEKEAARIAKASLGQAKASAESNADALKVARETIAAKYEEHDISLDMVDALKKGVPLIRQEAEARLRQISSTDKLSKEFEGLTQTVKSQVAGFLTLGAGLSLFKKGALASYEMANRLTARGMLGSITSLQAMSISLRISAQDLEEIMNKNRDIINTMGGGLAGMEALGEEALRVRKNLEYLGRDASKASFRFIEMSKKAGLTPKDGLAYRKNLDASMKQFKEFSGLFGDSFEDYANLMEQITEEEEVRKRLNVLSKTQLSLELEEIRQRTKNLKELGLSTEQIIEFNKSMQKLIDPEKNDASQRATESYSMAGGVEAMKQLLRKSGSTEDMKLLADLEAQQANTNRMLQLYRDGDQVELDKFMKEKDGGAASMRAIANAVAKTNQINPAAGITQFDKNFRNNLLERSGGLYQTIKKEGGNLATAAAKDKNLANKSPEEFAKIKANANANVAEYTAAAEALAAMTTAVEGAKAALESPFLQAVTGAVVALWALAAAATASAVGKKALESLGGGGLGEKGKGGKGGKGGGKLGAATSLLGIGIGGALAWNSVSDAQTKKDQNKISENDANKASGSAVGGFAGAATGATIGAGFGSVFPGPGTIIGGAVGGALGYFAGSSAGEKIGGMFGSDKTIEQQKGSRRASGTVTSSSSQDSAKSSGQNDIASIVSTAPGSMVVKRPDGSTVKLTGTRAWRNNNPGNLEYNDYTKKLGAIGTDGRFAIFPNLQTGTKAKQTLLFEGKNYKDISLSSAISRYAPSHENDTAAYQASVLSAVGGVNQPMSKYTPEQQSKILAAMAKQEGFKPGQSELISNSSGQSVQSSPTTTQSASTITSQDPVNNELKKQTALLSQLVNNSMGSSRIMARNDSYMQDSATVMSGSAS